MVKNTTAEKKITAKNAGGRPPAFDREAVVAASVLTFWTKGFNATTLADLEQATGVDRSSLYKSFGGKDGLYRSAATTYLDHTERDLFVFLYEGDKGIGDILAFIDGLGESWQSGLPRGCFIVNDMAMVPHFDATKRFMEQLEGGFGAALERASALGQIEAASVQRRSRFLTTTFVGINLVHRNAPEASTPLPLLQAVREEIESWSAA